MKKIYSNKIAVLLLSLFFSISLYSQSIAVNEVMSSNITNIEDEDESREDWIELYNYGNTAVNLNGFGLSDDPAVPLKWTFPNVTIEPNSYLLIWASDKNRKVVGQPLHTNFKISAGGEVITLSNASGTAINNAPAMNMPSDVSLGRQPDGTGTWLYFYNPTPNATNGNSGLAELLLAPTFSVDSGFFTSAFDVILSHPNPDAILVYTLDGSEPDINNLNGTTFRYKNVYPVKIGDAPGPFLTETFSSIRYSEPIKIVDRSSESDRLTTKNTRQEVLYVPINPVRKGTVVKAKSYVNGQPSGTVSKNYFVWPNGNPYNIPVISLQTQENQLFDYDLGTYTSGVDFDTWRAENPENPQSFRPEWNNYARSGGDWEYPVNVEIFSNSNSVFNQNAGFRIHGNNSRTFIVKSLRLYADTDYDERDNFEHNLFSSPIFDAPNAENNKFKRILMRGNGEGGAIAYDVVFNRIMQPVYNGLNRVQPVVHFINGEYWGLSAIRDRVDQHHYANNFNLDKDNVVIVDCEGSNCELDEGEDEDYLDYIDLRNYIINNDMANADFYEAVTNRFDIVSFIDHMVLQIYSGTNGYERAYWKARVPENGGYGDGKWRTSVKDFEPALSDREDWLEHWATITGSLNEELFTNLLKNPNFKSQFISRFADMLNSVFLPENFSEIVNKTFDEVSPYLAENFNRTPATNFYTASNKQNLLNWGNNHPQIQRNDILTHFSISNTVRIELSLSDEEAGSIKINTIDVSDVTPGISANPYPWTGIYFNNVPVQLVAKAKEGYVFSHWSGDVTGTDEEISFIPESDMQIQANYVEDENSLDLAYFWFMSSSIPNDLPLQSINSTYSSTNSAAAIQFDSSLAGYPFTSTAPEWRTASMERRNAPTPVNYFTSGNNNLPYNSDSMRGIQIKQPFKNSFLENAMRLVFSTTNMQQIKISFAVETDGAANLLVFDYWDGTNWVNSNISNPTVSIGSGYSLVEVDLQQVIQANNQSEFQFRIRFEGPDMFISEGKRVQFNNIAIEGQQVLSTPVFENNVKIVAYPNPTSSLINIQASESLVAAQLYNLVGQIVRDLKPNRTSFSIDIANLPEGIYLLKLKTDSQKEKTIKVVKK